MQNNVAKTYRRLSDVRTERYVRATSIDSSPIAAGVEVNHRRGDRSWITRESARKVLGL